MRVLVLVTAILASAVAQPSRDDFSGSRTVCPSFLMNCECTTMSSGVSVTCKSFTDRQQLRSTMRDLKGFNVQQFTINRWNISIENGDFADITLRKMDIESSSLEVKGINDGFGSDSPNSMEVLNFKNSTIEFSEKSWGSTRLTSIQFNNCKFKDFDPTKFEGLSVGTLRITNSLELNMPIATKLQNLQKYEHTGSNLVKLERNMLPDHAQSIVELDFKMNSIASISDDFLDGVTSLKKLTLNNNKLTTLSEKTFEKFNPDRKLQLHLANNLLECKGLEWFAEGLDKDTGKFQLVQLYPCIKGDGTIISDIRDLTILGVPFSARNNERTG